MSETSEVERLVEAARRAVSELDPPTLAPERCAELLRGVAALGKACAAAQARLATRAAAAHVHRRAGYADGAEWLAAAAGTSARAAAKAMSVAATVEELPATRSAMAAGELSVEAAAAVAATAVAVPGSEARLLDLARRKPLRVVQDEARRVRLEATDRDELAAAQREARCFRHWRDESGMVRFAGALTPADGVAVLARLDERTERRRRAARRTGSEGTWEQHAADAFVDAVVGAAGEQGVERSRPRRRSDVVFVVDLRAWRRGRARAGEPCHVVDGGPVPVGEVARTLAEYDPFVKAVLHDGVEVQRVVHWGRHVPAEVRTALELGPPPAFDGMRCGCGCGRRHKLQLDHVHPRAAGGPTSLSNLQPRTPTEHALKTERDRAAGLLRASSGRAPRAPAEPP